MVFGIERLSLLENWESLYGFMRAWRTGIYERREKTRLIPLTPLGAGTNPRRRSGKRHPPRARAEEESFGKENPSSPIAIATHKKFAFVPRRTTRSSEDREQRDGPWGGSCFYFILKIRLDCNCIVVMVCCAVLRVASVRNSLTRNQTRISGR
mmetsp:Transcript_13515/g.31778  ORF Transcript_13515/g.31778 Transcript_13515/m.31778 type:complete len:153 (+) Transcript_13515:357-815(+)